MPNACVDAVSLKKCFVWLDSLAWSQKILQGPSPVARVGPGQEAHELFYLLAHSLGLWHISWGAEQDGKNEALSHRHHILANIRSIRHRPPNFFALQGLLAKKRSLLSSFNSSVRRLAGPSKTSQQAPGRFVAPNQRRTYVCEAHFCTVAC